MAGYDNYTISGNFEKIKIPFKDSYRFKLALLGILLLVYDFIFLSLYVYNNRSYSNSIMEIMQMRTDYEKGVSLLRTMGSDTDIYMNQASEERIQEYMASQKEVQKFVLFLNKEEMGIYLHDLAVMCERYLAEEKLAIEKAENGQVQESLEYAENAAGIQQKLLQYSEYASMELQELMSQRIEMLHTTMKRRLYWLIFSFLVCTVAVAMIVVIQINAVMRPIKALTREIISVPVMEQWKIRNIHVKSRGEMGMLQNSFYQMLNQLRIQHDELLRTQQIEKELQEEQKKNLAAEAKLYRTQLQVFQSQINSHFLFNSLNIISWLAFMEKAPDTRNAATLLAQFLRTVLNQFDRVVTLEEELSRIEQYVAIQTLRFRDRIQFDTEMDPELAMLKLPSMIFQPLVENAYAHGVGAKPSGYIRCCAVQEKEKIWLYVWDDGGELTPERKSQVLDMLENPEGDRVGLANVYQRLKLFFGESVSPFIEAERGVYTKIGFCFFDKRDAQETEYDTYQEKLYSEPEVC